MWGIFMRKIISNIGAFGILISLILAFIWHLYSSWVLYQMYGFIWAIISFVFPVVSEVAIIILYGLVNGFFNYFVFGWILIILLALISIFIENKFSEEISHEVNDLNFELGTKCRNCKTLNNDKNSYCRKCGVRLFPSINKYKMKVDTNNKKNCRSCNSICDIKSLYCGRCGTLFENQIQEVNKSEFGNGESIKFFNFLYNFIPIFIILNLLYSLNSFNSIINNSFSGDLKLFFSYSFNIYLVIFFIISILLNGILIFSRLNNNKVAFAKTFIYRSVLVTLEPIISLIFIYIDFKDINQFFASSLALFIGQLILNLITYVYLTKRFEFKWFDFSNIL